MTRRTALGGALAVPLSFGLPWGAVAGLPPDVALARALSQVKIPIPDATLTLLRFDAARDGGDLRMTAVAELGWPKGVLRRKVSVSQGPPQDALNRLFDGIVTKLQSAADL